MILRAGPQVLNASLKRTLQTSRLVHYYYSYWSVAKNVSSSNPTGCVTFSQCLYVGLFPQLGLV